MERLNRLAENLKKTNIENIINKAIRKALDKNKGAVKSLNIDNQLYTKGEDTEGNKLRRIGADYEGYAESTIKRKKKKGQPYDRITLRDKQYFHKGMRINTNNDFVKFTAKNSYTKYIKKFYGKKILGLQEENKRVIAINYLRNEIIKTLTTEL